VIRGAEARKLAHPRRNGLTQAGGPRAGAATRTKKLLLYRGLSFRCRPLGAVAFVALRRCVTGWTAAATATAAARRAERRPALATAA
jgi:hypothetical protein